MRALPEQALYLPFEPGPYRMAMDLVTVPESHWFELDHHYPSEMAERRHRLATAHADVFAATPTSDAARAETLHLVSTALTTHHPDWFTSDGRTIHNHLTAETWHTDSLDPLELAGRLVQEDLCLIEHTEAGPTLTAAILCFPSRWRLHEKLGKPLTAVHHPVPFYADRLARPVDRFMRHVKPGHIAARLNWSLLDNPALFQPDGKWRRDTAPDITPDNAGHRLFLRVERQTLRRLPFTRAVLFGIRVHVYPLHQVINRPARAAALAEAVQALPPEVQHYKSLPPFREALLGWLRAFRHPQLAHRGPAA